MHFSRVKVQKGYRVYDEKAKGIFYSRDVKFDEMKNHQVQEELAKQPVTLNPVVEPESELELETELEPEPEPVLNGEETLQIPQPRRSTRVRRPVDYYTPGAYITLHHEPTSFKEAIDCPEEKKWSEAMSKEMKSLENNNVWKLTVLPPGKKAISCKWVYKVKTNSDGSLERYKARLVARGFDQKFGSDYDETFCPFIRQESLRTLVALSTKKELELHHVDVQTAF